MIEIGRIFINDKNGIEIEIHDKEISDDILKTNSESVLDRVSEILCNELNDIYNKANKSK